MSSTQASVQQPEEKPTEAKADEGLPVDAKPEGAKPTLLTGEEPKEVSSEPGDKTPQDPAEQKPEVPAEYDLKLPEGAFLKDEQVAQVASFAKEQGLTQAQAQAFLERENATQGAWKESQAAEVRQTVDGWYKATESDAEVGGQAFKESVLAAHRAIERFGTPALKQAFEESGLGNHPELVRIFSRIGKAMSDDKLVLSGSQPSQPRAPEDVLYGNTQKKE